MTWTTSQPTGSSKIRLLPNLLQARWENIEGGEIPCRKWQLEVRAGDPGSISGSGLIYTKAGGAGNAELFYKDDDSPSSNVIRLTRRGGIGYFDQPIYSDTFVTQDDASSEVDNNQDAFCSAWGRISSNGDVQAGYKIIFVNSRDSTGKYTIDFDPVLRTAEGYSILITPRDTSNPSRTYVSLITAQSASRFSVRFQRFTAGSFDDDDVGFCFAVFGSRI